MRLSASREKERGEQVADMFASSLPFIKDENPHTRKDSSARIYIHARIYIP